MKYKRGVGKPLWNFWFLKGGLSVFLRKFFFPSLSAVYYLDIK
jgi:hypothetical protein